MDMNLSKLREIVKDREALHAVVHGVVNSGTQISPWTTTTLNLTPYAPMASLIAQLVKNLPATQQAPVWPLGQEDPLEKG